MATLNKVLLIGNLTRDPELRYTPSGQALCSFRIAVNRVYNDKSGQKQEDTCFLSVTVWGKTGENCASYLKKGRPVFIEGRLQSRSWQGEDGQKKSAIDVVAERVQFLSSGGGGQRQGSAPGADESGPPPDVAPEDDIPF